MKIKNKRFIIVTSLFITLFSLAYSNCVDDGAPYWEDSNDPPPAPTGYMRTLTRKFQEEPPSCPGADHDLVTEEKTEQEIKTYQDKWQDRKGTDPQDQCERRWLEQKSKKTWETVVDWHEIKRECIWVA